MTAYLQQGDEIHIILPSTGDPERDERELDDMRAAYARFGVNIAIATTSATLRDEQPVGAPQPRVVAVFRTPANLNEGSK